MKNIFTLFLVCALGLQVQAQDLNGSKNTLLQFSVILTNDILDALDPYSPATTREKENYTEAKSVLTQLIHDKAFEVFMSEISDRGIELEPKNTLEDYDVLYNDYGYPNVLIPKSVIKKAQKNGHEADNYWSINIIFGAGSNILGAAKLAKQFKQTTEAKCDFFNASDRKKSNTIKSKVSADSPVKAKDFPRGKFDKMEVEYMELLVEKVTPDLEATIAKMVDQM